LYARALCIASAIVLNSEMETVDKSFWKFVDGNVNADAAGLRLKYHGCDGIDYALAITQVECRKKFAKKLRLTLAGNPEFLFPSVLAGEQATSDLLAEYHASLIGEGDRVADLTAGLGIDASHLASRAATVVAVERDKIKAECLACNFGSRIEVVNSDCRDFLEDCADDAFDAVFIDPARRAADGSRVFALADCEPDLIEMLPLLSRKAKRLIVKASPMLDITNLLRDLPGARRIIALGSTTECKELIAVVDFRADSMPVDEVPIEAVTLTDGKPASAISFTRSLEAKAEVAFAAPEIGKYLLEPYPSVMKAAPYNMLSRSFGICKIHPNTQLYVSDSVVDDFPGEAFKIEAVIPYESKHIKRLKSTYPQIQVTTRNFDVTADALRKKLGVKDGGERRLFAVTGKMAVGASQPQKMMIVTH